MPTIANFDDFGLTAARPLNEDALLTFTEVIKIFGFDLELPKWGREQLSELLSFVLAGPRFRLASRSFTSRI